MFFPAFSIGEAVSNDRKVKEPPVVKKWATESRDNRQLELIGGQHQKIRNRL
jgi:hypothetical protein